MGNCTNPECPTCEARKELHATLDRMVHEIDPPTFEGEDEPVILRSWVSVATVMHPDGRQQMYVFSSDAMGEDELPPWEKKGLLSYAMEEWEVLFDDGDED